MLANPSLHPARYDELGWRATFSTTGMEHSATSAIGTCGAVISRSADND